MVHKSLKKIIFGLFALPLLVACSKDKGPSIDDHFLNYQIEKIPATKDYTVGAFYINFGNFNAAVKEVPTVGKYNFSSGRLPTGIMEKHIDYAATGKINYFIFSLRSATRSFSNYTQDSVLIKSFLDSQNSSKMNFAISYNLNIGTNVAAGQLPVNNTTAIEDLAPSFLEGFFKDFERMAFYFSQPNYQKVNGKPLIVITPAQNLASTDSEALYNELRARVRSKGFELYIVGMQDGWTPPQRYYFRFHKCVDAMYEDKMSDAGNQPDRVYLFPQVVDQNWIYWKQSLRQYNIDFIPSISPGYQYSVRAPASRNLPL